MLNWLNDFSMKIHCNKDAVGELPMNFLAIMIIFCMIDSMDGKYSIQDEHGQHITSQWTIQVPKIDNNTNVSMSWT